MNNGAFIQRETLIELLQAAIEELKGNASFEGRIQYTCMVDDCPKDHFAVRAFVRTGNDMGQGGCVVIDGDVVIDAPPSDRYEEGIKAERARIVKSLRDAVASDKVDPNKPITEVVMAIAKGTLLGFADRIEAGTQ
jgi:hypothetical protein